MRVLARQSGVMRTNCMDCLDRTNVVQGVFSRIIAQQQLHKMGLTPPPAGKPFEVFSDKEMEQTFRNAWTDNADVLSLLYTGTPALKTDFTRTGKRSTAGALQDGKHSMIRYYINNFCDGYNNDCLDLSQNAISAKQKLNPRGVVTPLKQAFALLIFAMAASAYALMRAFPTPAVEGLAEEDLAQAGLKTSLLHGLVLTGVALVGLLLIQSKYRAQCASVS